MSIRVAINGFGRIGRGVLRALYESNRNDDIQLIAINELGSIEASMQRLKNDVSHGQFAVEVSVSGDNLVVAHQPIHYSSIANPVKLPWKDLDIDVVLECSGKFTQAEQSYMHCLAGAKKVLISALSDEKVDATVVYGVNHNTLQSDFKIVSNGSCTSNCLAQLAAVLDADIGIESGLSTTLHAYDNEQLLSISSDLGDVRSLSMMPTKTNSPTSIGDILPNLSGKIDGISIRAPTMNVALVDLTFTSKKTTSVDEVNALMKKSALASAASVLKYSQDAKISADFMHNAASCIFDASQTKVTQGNLVKVVAWYDNEWGFSNRMLDTTEAMMAC
jgi:glyceraldehyde 3-phosphate dehydrogenase